jgi:hypothetical protein
MAWRLPLLLAVGLVLPYRCRADGGAGASVEHPGAHDHGSCSTARWVVGLGRGSLPGAVAASFDELVLAVDALRDQPYIVEDKAVPTHLATQAPAGPVVAACPMPCALSGRSRTRASSSRPPIAS